MRTRNVYLIDTENVAHHWVGKFQFASKKDKLVIFMGPENINLPLPELKTFLSLYPANQVEFVPTLPGDNAMDFFIVSKLGEMIATGPKSHYHVVSNDSDFDPVIRGHMNRGLFVDRIPAKGKTKNKAKKKAKKKAESSAPVVVQQKPSLSAQDKESLKKTCTVFFRKYNLSDVQAGLLADVVIKVPAPFKGISGALNEPLQKQVRDNKKVKTIMKEAKKELPTLMMSSIK